MGACCFHGPRAFQQLGCRGFSGECEMLPLGPNRRLTPGQTSEYTKGGSPGVGLVVYADVGGMEPVRSKHEAFRVLEPSRSDGISRSDHRSHFSGYALPADALGGQAASRISALQVAL
jgi:hypothetical protein